MLGFVKRRYDEEMDNVTLEPGQVVRIGESAADSEECKPLVGYVGELKWYTPKDLPPVLALVELDKGWSVYFWPRDLVKATEEERKRYQERVPVTPR